MHITNECDYAVRIVRCIAENETRIDAGKISEQTAVPLRFALKILRNLAASGILKSFKGTKGGYELGKAPTEITLYDVVRVVEGEYQFCRCLETNEGNCTAFRVRQVPCKARIVFHTLTDMVVEYMQGVTVADLVE